MPCAVSLGWRRLQCNNILLSDCLISTRQQSLILAVQNCAAQWVFDPVQAATRNACQCRIMLFSNCLTLFRQRQHLLPSFEACARQAEQTQLGTSCSNQLSPASSVLCYPRPFQLCMWGGEVLVNSCQHLPAWQTCLNHADQNVTAAARDDSLNNMPNSCRCNGSQRESCSNSIHDALAGMFMLVIESEQSGPALEPGVQSLSLLEGSL